MDMALLEVVTDVRDKTPIGGHYTRGRVRENTYQRQDVGRHLIAGNYVLKLPPPVLAKE